MKQQCVSIGRFGKLRNLWVAKLFEARVTVEGAMVWKYLQDLSLTPRLGLAPSESFVAATKAYCYSSGLEYQENIKDGYPVALTTTMNGRSSWQTGEGYATF